MIAVEQPVRDAPMVGRAEHSRTDEPADRVVDGIAAEGCCCQERKGCRAIERARGGQRARREQQRVAGQERRDDKPGFSEDYQEEQAVYPGAVSGHEVEKMTIAVKDEVDKVGHAADVSPLRVLRILR